MHSLLLPQSPASPSPSKHFPLPTLNSFQEEKSQLLALGSPGTLYTSSSQLFGLASSLRGRKSFLNQPGTCCLPGLASVSQRHLKKQSRMHEWSTEVPLLLYAKVQRERQRESKETRLPPAIKGLPGWKNGGLAGNMIVFCKQDEFSSSPDLVSASRKSARRKVS